MAKTTAVLSRNYSSKALIWAGLILTASLTSAVFVFPAIFHKKKKDIPQIVKATNSLLLDTDNDGLQNWEEELYKTDSVNPDSDGDGASDGEEIKLGRNPALAGPDDRLTGPSVEEPQPEQNLTQIIFEEFMRNGGMATLLNQERSGNPDTAVAQKVEAFLKTGFIPAKAIDKLEKVDGLILENNKDTKTIKEYVGRLVSIMNNYSSRAPEEDDLDLFLAIVESQNKERFKELEPYRELAEKTAKDLREMSIPENFADLHGKMVWLMEESARQLAVLEKAEQDPAAALAVIPARIDLKIQAAKFYEELSQELEG
ncbi:MAG: hypothetical protein Q8R29_00545 [bacterium]|nr:hypothetical protein [bacterium]